MDRKFLIRRILELGLLSEEDMKIGKRSTQKLEELYFNYQEKLRQERAISEQDEEEIFI